ncbi:MAG: DNA polymerase III subunit alpha, partial [Acidimicrobiia bacterium]|nr:DNA polymerase III subunit alpha [Acidimicrobiia bacterium]
MLDGAARVKDMVRVAKSDDQPAIAITDHGVLYGVVDFYKAATAAGVKPIIGVEAYVTPGSRFDRPSRADNQRYHMTLLAENEIGYRNLMKMVSASYLDGYYYKPRMDIDLLSTHAEGVIATSGCLGGHVPSLLAPDASREEGNRNLARDFDGAVKAAAMYQDIFGKDNYFIEVADHGIEAQRRILPDLVQISKLTGAGLLAANDAHYIRAEDAESHDVLLCIQTGSTIDDPTRFKFEGTGLYLKSAREMRAMFPEDLYPAACDNTLEIADRADVHLEFGKILLPQFPVPDGHTETSYLRELVYDGARHRYGAMLPDEVTDRIEHELRIIEEMGFPAYFLIVWDLIRYARERGIRTGPGRGSAAGAIVSYCLRITDLDPLRYGMIFERFLNPGRRQMPDIDMDFDERYRADVIRYASEKYGSDHVAQIVTFSTIKGRQAIRDGARVLGLPYSVGDRVAKMMPPAILGKEATLAMCLEPPDSDADQTEKDWYANASEMRTAYEADPDVKRVVETARGLEGLRRQDSIHAAAVVISPSPVMELVPVQQKGEGAEIVTQYEMHGIESLGLLKMDFLGLRNLSTIERCLELVERAHGKRVDIDHVPLEDPATFELLRAGETIGVFQLEGSAMRSLIRNLQPESFEDIIAVNALFRPGPMGMGMHYEYADRKNKRKLVTYPHPAIEQLLESTYGIIVYQEQVMQVAAEMAGYDMAEAENLRKAMGKKIKSVMGAEKEKFVAGCVSQGHPRDLGDELWDAIEPFAGYGFNKSHSACYAYVAFQTAYLKAHYPAEYMAALLTSTKRDKDRTAIYLNECRTMGLQVLVPDVNESDMDYVTRDGKILFGMSAVRNVGEGVVEKIVEARTETGPFEDFYDFVDRVDTGALNKRTIESLIKAGGFDSLGYARKGLLLEFEDILDATIVRRRNEDVGQFSLFGSGDGAVEMTKREIGEVEWDKRAKLAFEKEMLGLYISDHPLLGVQRALRAASTCGVDDLIDMADNSRIVVGGMVGAVSKRFTRRGEPMIFFQLEDLAGSVEVMCFPKTVAEYGPLIREDAVLLVTGSLDHKGDEVKVRAQSLKEPDLRIDDLVRLEVPARLLSADKVNK